MPYPRQLVNALLLIPILSAASMAQEGKAGLSLSVNGTSETAVYRGWPLLIEVHAFLEDGEVVRLQWPAPIRLTIRGSGGAESWPLETPGASEDAPVDVTEERSAQALWTLSGEATSALSDGDYTAQAEHPGAGASRLILLKVSDEPAELSREQASLKARVRSRYEEFTGTNETALQILTDWLGKTPDDIGALGQKADLLERMDRIKEALDTAELALHLFYEQFKEATHPPSALLRRLQILSDKLNP